MFCASRHLLGGPAAISFLASDGGAASGSQQPDAPELEASAAETPAHPVDAYVAPPDEALETAILGLLRAGGDREACGKEAYFIREMIEERYPRDMLVPPELRHAHMAQAKHRLLRALTQHPGLITPFPCPNLEQLEALRDELWPIVTKERPIPYDSRTVVTQEERRERRRAVADLFVERLLQTRRSIQDELLQLENDLAQQQKKQNRNRGERRAKILRLTLHIRPLVALDKEMGELIDSRPAAPLHAFLLAAQRIIERAESLHLWSNAVSGPGWTRVRLRKGRKSKEPKKL
jgi:hypothetical protein